MKTPKAKITWKDSQDRKHSLIVSSYLAPTIARAIAVHHHVYDVTIRGELGSALVDSGGNLTVEWTADKGADRVKQYGPNTLVTL